MTANRRNQRGMTIVELMVVMTIMAVIMAVGGYSLSTLGGNDLRNDALRMSAVIKYTYANAALNNARYRLVVELGSGTYFTEVTEEPVISASESAADEEMLTEEARELAKSKERENDLFDETEDNPFGVNRRVTFERVQDIVIKETKLSEGITFSKVYTPKFPDEPLEEGRASVSMFPNGYMEPILIVMKDADGNAYSLMTESMTGRVIIRSGEIDPPDGFGEQESDD
ncbi:MAG: prepilin-type N-terminal cleavage/methylation domain-containing protein [bacterium]